jgi:two-component system cell cycle response regulator
VRAATVLIADDSLVVRTLVRGELEDEGYEVCEAVDGAAAIEHCRSAAPDVVLLDVEMPGLDGYEVLARLKADSDLKDIPVVFLTSRSRRQDVVAGLRGGAHDYLTKPFDTPELLARVASAVHMKQLQDQLRERSDQLDQLSRTDALTGLFNRRHLDEELALRHADARRYGQDLCLLLLDIDHFKAVNDTFGHPAGDAVLRSFAARLQGELRGGDIAGRWGGEEFLVILPHTDLDGARMMADRIRLAVAATPITADRESVAVTVSGGCASGSGDSVQALLAKADARLYEAKLTGRNRIVSSDAASPGPAR